MLVYALNTGLHFFDFLQVLFDAVWQISVGAHYCTPSLGQGHSNGGSDKPAEPGDQSGSTRQGHYHLKEIKVCMIS